MFNKTPTQKTKNGGYHIIFSVTEERMKNFPVSRTGLILDDIHYNVDVKFKNLELIRLNILIVSLHLVILGLIIILKKYLIYLNNLLKL
jgi:hypothetical protein